MSSSTVREALICGGPFWKETLAEYRSMDEQQVKDLTFEDKVSIVSSMFAEFRNCIIQALPEDLSDKELKKEVYFRTYGEPLPGDFFKD